MPEYDLYLLVHPERYPYDDEADILGRDINEYAEDYERKVTNFGSIYGAEVLAAVSRAQAAICLLYPGAIEEIAEEAGPAERRRALGPSELLALAHGKGGEALVVTEGVPLAVFDGVLEGNNRAVESALAQLQPAHAGATVLAGGCMREDCVRRAVKTMTANGFVVSVCERTTFPFTPEALATVLSSAAPRDEE